MVGCGSSMPPGAKVQTLMIPMLASGKDGGKKAGLLNKFRRTSDGDMSDGCDPAVFAEQIAEYLDRSAAERAHNRPIDDEVTHEQTAVIETVAESPTALMVAPSIEPPDSDAAAVDDDRSLRRTATKTPTHQSHLQR